MDWPKDGENTKTFHDLSFGKVKRMWYWTGSGWCTKPSNSYITKTERMIELGWIYVRQMEKL